MEFTIGSTLHSSCHPPCTLKRGNDEAHRNQLEMLVLCKPHWAICTPQDWSNSIHLITLLLPAPERKAFYEVSDITYTGLISTFCPETVFWNSDEKQTNKNPTTIRKINILLADRICYTLSPPIKSAKPKRVMSPSDLPNLAEILEG